MPFKENTLKIALVHDTDARRNIGCRLTSSMLKRSLINAADNLDLNAFIHSVPWPFRRRTLLEEFQSMGWLSGTVTDEKLKKYARLEYGETGLSAVSDADLIVFQVEGRIKKNDSIEKIFRLFSLPIYASLALRKKTIAMNGTICDRDDQNYDIIRELLGPFFMVSCRDRRSAEALNVDFIPDAAFSRTPSLVSKTPLLERRYVIVTTTAGKNGVENVNDARTAISICQSMGWRPLILTMDHKALQPLFDEVLSLGGRVVDYADISYAEELINDCICHIGGRYHMAILSAVCGVPSFLVTTNSHKNDWLVENFYGIEWLDDLKSTCLQEVIGGMSIDQIIEDARAAGAAQRSGTQRVLLHAMESGMQRSSEVMVPNRMDDILRLVRKDMRQRIMRSAGRVLGMPS